jgi:citrate lyase subunit beta/citryl-CoA lyase
MNKKAIAGNRGDSVRSDCYVELEITESGGIQLDLKSKVKSLFGEKIIDLCNKVLQHFQITNASLYIEDSGALDYIIAARLEAAIKLVKNVDSEYLLPIIPQNTNSTKIDSFRRSRLYLPGNTPKLAINAGIHYPDGIILDLEDSVAPAKKFEARFLIRNTLRAVDFYGAERMVRINQLPTGLDDLEMIIPHHVNLILIPKTESAEQIIAVNQKMEEIKNRENIQNPVYLMPIIESARGVINSYQIASAASNICALAIGLEDYTADIGAQRTQEGKESFFARCLIVNSAKAAGIQAIDSVFSDVSDMDALKENVLASKALGFDGMGCIHPRQIDVIHRYFAPDDIEIDKAKKIVAAFYLAEEKGLGVVSIGSKMIDPPVVKRAEKIIEIAIKTGKLDENWRENL